MTKFMRGLNTSRLVLLVVLVSILALGVGIGRALAGSDIEARHFDRSVARIHSGSSYVDVSAAVYTSYVTLITIEPPIGVAMSHCQIHLDLDTGADGESFAVDYTSETIQFAIGRKIQGQWRIDDERESATVAGDNADNRMVTLDIGIVGPDEDVRVYVKLSAEQTDVEIAYVCEYLASDRAVFTDVAN